MTKESVFNYKVMSGTELLMYNSLSKTYLKTEKNKELVNSILDNPVKYAGNNIYTELYKHGFITECDDELELAEFKYHEFVYDNTLELCIMPTEFCNFRCVYCYEKFLTGNISEENISRLIIWLEKNIKKYDKLHVSWFGGEPLLALEQIYRVSEKIIEICKINHIPYAASITTNGYLLSKNVLKKLLKYHVVSYQVTIDGDKFSHDSQRVLRGGLGTYNVIINNLYEISQNIKSGIFKIIIRNNVTLDTLSHIPNFIDDMYEKFGKDRRFGFYFRPVGKWGNKDIKVEESKMLCGFDEMYSIVLNSNKILNYSPYRAMLNEQICFAQKRNQMIVRADGTIAKCTMLLDSSENNIGRFTPDGIVIDQYKVARWLGFRKVAPESCNTCHLYATCYSHTCPAKGYVLDNKKGCGYEVMGIDYVLQILNKINLFENIDEV